MCRIFGEVAFKGSLSPREDFKDLTGLSRSGGPDSTEYWRDNICQLGFNRLAILDTTTNGNQPIISPSGRYVMVLNGEVYNYKDLQKQYSIDSKVLRSTSDSEVIVHLLERVKIKELSALMNGMFAMFIWDSSERIGYLLRDFAGIKPLFYGINKFGIVFSSQFNQIYKHSWFSNNLTINRKGFYDYLQFGYMHNPDTVYEDVHQLKPGHLLKIDQVKGKVSIESYCNSYDSIACDFSESDDGLLNTFNQTFKNVINSQMNSDVPLGTFLSGGIDSPLVTSFASESRPDICSFTMSLDSKEINEGKIAGKYAEYLNVKNIQEKFSVDRLLQIVDDHFSVYPEPFGDPSSLPTFLICNRASNKFKVMLSGDGGDEVFWGYPRFLHIVENAFWFNLPYKVRRAVSYSLRRLNFGITYGVNEKSLGDWQMLKHSHNSRKFLNELLPNTSNSHEIINMYRYDKRNSRKKDILQWLRYNEFHAHLQRVLIKVDRASMGNGLEVRVPFLDKEVLKLSQRICPELGIKHNSLKQLLQKSMANKFQNELINKRKMGFDIPLKQWINGPLKNDVLQLLLDTPVFGEEFFDKKIWKSYVNDFYSKKGNCEWGIWIMYALQKWKTMHVDK